MERLPVLCLNCGADCRGGKCPECDYNDTLCPKCGRCNLGCILKAHKPVGKKEKHPNFLHSGKAGRPEHKILLRKKTITITDEQIMLLERLGQDNLSEGVRLLTLVLRDWVEYASGPEEET